MFCKGQAGTWPPLRPLTQHSARVACPEAECNSLVTWSPTALLKLPGGLHPPILHVTQVTSRLRLTTGRIKKRHRDCEKRQGWNTSKACRDWKRYTEETGTVWKKKKMEQRERLNQHAMGGWERNPMVKTASGMRKSVRACVCLPAWACAYRQPSPRRTVEEKVMNWGRKNQDRKYLGDNKKILWIFFFNNLVHILNFDNYLSACHCWKMCSRKVWRAVLKAKVELSQLTWASYIVSIYCSQNCV